MSSYKAMHCYFFSLSLAVILYPVVITEGTLVIAGIKFQETYLLKKK